VIKSDVVEVSSPLSLKKIFIAKSLKLLIAALKNISRKKRRLILSRIGKLILFFSKKTQKRSIGNIRRAMPSLSEDEACSLAFSAYGHCAFGVSEAFWLDELEPKIFCDEQTLEIFHSGKGACIATMHLGCYEAVPLAVAKLTFYSTTLSNVPTFIENGLQFYAQAGVTAINKKSHHAFIELIKKAKENSYVSLHCDLWGNEQELVFFNQKTKAPAGIALISKMTQKPLLLGYSIYDKQGNVKVYFETVYKETCDNLLSTEKIMATIYQRFEEIIMQYPEQWYWSYKRWRI
jgi:KDO2-lipid IV(A) lauroyltransferase